MAKKSPDSVLKYLRRSVASRSRNRELLALMVLMLAVGNAGWAGSERGEREQAEAAQAQIVKEVPGGPTKKQPAVDQHGDPLPERAVGRLGAQRFRHEGFSPHSQFSLVYTPDGKTLIGSTYSGLVFWDAATGREQRRFPALIPGAEPGCIAISPDGTLLAAGFAVDLDGAGPSIKVWDLRNGTPLKLPEVENPGFHEVFFTPDGKSLLATRSEPGDPVQLDLQAGQVKKLFHGGNTEHYYRLAISPDGKTLAVAVHSETDRLHPHSVQLRDFATGKLLRRLHDLSVTDRDASVSALRFTPDGQRLALAEKNRIHFYAPATGKKLGVLEANLYAVTDLIFTPDSRKLICTGAPMSSTSGARTFFCDVDTAKVLHTVEKGASSCAPVALSPDGKTVAVGVGSTVQLWHLPTRKELFAEERGHRAALKSLLFSPDGKVLVSADALGSVLAWETTTWRHPHVLAKNVGTPEFSPDGTKLAFGDWGYPGTFAQVRIWDMATRQENSAVRITDAAAIVAAKFSADGRKLFTLDMKKNAKTQRIRHWDLATGKQVAEWNVSSSSRIWAERGGPSPEVFYQPRYFGFLGQHGKAVYGWTDEHGVEILDADWGRRQLIGGKQPFHFQPALSWDGRMVALGVGQSEIDIWEVVTGQKLFSLQGRQGAIARGYRPLARLMAAINWSSDGRLLATGDGRNDPWTPTQEQTVRLWDTATGKQLACLNGLKADVGTVAFAPDGTRLAAGLCDGTSLIYDVHGTVAPLTQKLGKEELEWCWEDLGARNATRAHRGLGKLVGAARESVPMLRERLQAVPRANQKLVQQRIAELNSDKFALREAAMRELVKIGDQVQTPIRNTLHGDIPLETRRRLESVLDSLAVVSSLETVRIIRAITVLERIGSPEAQAVLAKLAGGAPGARETEEAKASLERLKPGALLASPRPGKPSHAPAERERAEK